MDKSAKFLLPAPNFDRKPMGRPKPHFLTPSGMTLLPREKQPPPMYGARGSTVPAKHLPGNPFNANPNVEPTPSTPPQRQYCQGCEMELQSAEDMRRHRAAHESCPVDGCQYRGHASVMDKHVTAKHATGLFEKFKKLSTPEEIAAWREERRKKYPTAANTQMRQAAQEQRQRRGERLEAKTSRFGKREDRKQMRNGNETKNTAEAEPETKAEPAEKSNVQQPASSKTEIPPRGKGRNEKRANKRRKMQQAKQTPKPNEAKVKETAVDVTKAEEQCGGVFMFRGTSKFKDYKHAKEPVATNALMGLLGMYGSDDDEEESENEQQPPTKEVSEDDNKINEEVFVQNAVELQENIITEPCTVAPGTFNNEDDKSNSPKNELHVRNVHSKETEELSCNKNGDELNEIIEIIASDEEAPDEVPISHSSDYTRPVPQSTPALTCDEPAVKRTKTATDEIKKPPPSHQNKRKSGLDYRKARLRKQNTMLEKLLEPDIRHERNVLLQCVRYVCENGFFGIGQSLTKPN